MANFSQNLVWNGLGTLTTVLTPDVYTISGKISLPTITNGGGVSACLVTINQNGSAIYTGVAGAEGFATRISCTGTDTVTIVYSSAAAPDQVLNSIKSTISIASGQ